MEMTRSIAWPISRGVERERCQTRRWIRSSMASDTFIDTSGFYSHLVKGDERHVEAANFMRQASQKKRRLVTTDYVLDETATLLQARGRDHLVRGFFESVFASRACQIVWMDPD